MNRPVSRPAQRVVTSVAALMVLMGVGLLGWVAWQVWGTTAVSQHRHAQLVDQLEERWSQDGSAPVGSEPGSKAGTSTTQPRGVRTEFGTATAIVRIPAFGDQYAVPVLEGTGTEVLAAGFGHRAGTAPAGGRGNYVLAGHRITHGEPLRNMPELQLGDQVIVETAAATYTYVLDTPGNGLTVQSDDAWVTDPKPRNPAGGTGPIETSRQLLTLITCADFTHTPNRLAVFGHLEETVPRSAIG